MPPQRWGRGVEGRPTFVLESVRSSVRSHLTPLSKTF